MHVYVCLITTPDVHACGGLKLTLGVFLYCSPFSFVPIWSFTEPGACPFSKTGWPMNSKANCLCPLQCWVFRDGHHKWALHELSGYTSPYTCPQVLTLVQQAHGHLTHLLCSRNICFKSRLYNLEIPLSFTQGKWESHTNWKRLFAVAP